MVRAKKHLGQHFLKDEDIALNIVKGLQDWGEYKNVLEIGPGTGVLTKYLLQNEAINFKAFDVDQESIKYLKEHYPKDNEKFLFQDFLKSDIKTVFEKPVGIIGNFPYNISSQIFFKVLEIKEHIPEVVGMLQKEVAERIASPHGSKKYGILSVFLQAYYDIEYLFTVHEDVFIPPPKVKSGVIRLKRNKVDKLDCDEKLFYRVVKQGFNNRRKTLKNALKPLNLPEEILGNEYFTKRAEQLSVDDFVSLVQLIESSHAV